MSTELLFVIGLIVVFFGVISGLVLFFQYRPDPVIDMKEKLLMFHLIRRKLAISILKKVGDKHAIADQLALIATSNEMMTSLDGYVSAIISLMSGVEVNKAPMFKEIDINKLNNLLRSLVEADTRNNATFAYNSALNFVDF